MISIPEHPQKNVLRILMISPQFRPLVGGYERAGERLSESLVTMGHSVTVVAERRDPRWPAKEERFGVHVRRLWCIYRQRLHLLTSLVSFILFFVLKGRKFNVYHVHQYGLHAVVVAFLSKIIGRPIVLQLTSSGAEGLGKVASELLIAPLAKCILKSADAVVALSRETRAEAIAFGLPSGRVHVIGTGIEIEKYRPVSENERLSLRCKLGLEVKGVLLFVGRLAPEKNPNGLLKAWKNALPLLPEGWKLVLVGDGPMRAELASFVKSEKLSATVILTGQRSNVEDWMAAADIYVLPSHIEGLSNTTLEAMASGLPVVSTRVSGSVETLEETGAGLVVAVGRMDQVTNAIVHLAANIGLRCQMGQRGRSVVESRYSIKHVAERHETLYRHVLAEQARKESTR